MSSRELLKFEENWQIVTGCTEIGPGCDSCPSLQIADAMEGTPGHDFEHGFRVRLWPQRLPIPEYYKDPTVFYVALGSDLFHDFVPDEFIYKAFEVMNYNQNHLFEICTKRADRLAYFAKNLNWTPNIYMGVTVASKACKWRLDALRGIPAVTKYVSMCPLLDDLGELSLEGIDRVGVVEESWGPMRKVKSEWVENIRSQCSDQGVDFSFTAGVKYVDA